MAQAESSSSGELSEGPRSGSGSGSGSGSSASIDSAAVVAEDKKRRKALTKTQKKVLNPRIDLRKSRPGHLPRPGWIINEHGGLDPIKPNDPRWDYEDPREDRPGDLDPEGTGRPVEEGEDYSNNSISIGNNALEINPILTKGLFYNTVSCPCSTYVIKDSNGKIGCEREYYGVKQYFKPSVRTNHFLENNTPKLGDKWACADKTCTQSGYTFDGFYIVSIEKNTSGTTSSIVNSTRFTDSCFIPKTTYFSDFTTKPSKAILDYYQTGTVTTIDDIPIFINDQTALGYKRLLNQGEEIFYYDWNGITGFSPEKITHFNKAINGVWLDNRNLIFHGLGSRPDNFEAMINASRPGNFVVSSSGQTVTIRINGLNQPTISLTLKDSSGCSILKKQIKNFSIPTSGEYILEQKIPALPSGTNSETYELIITPTADTSYYRDKSIWGPGIIKEKIYQFKNPTITIVGETCTTCGTHTNTGTASSVTYSSDSFSQSTDDRGFTSLIHTTTITETAGNAYYYLSSRPNVKDCITRNDTIKKVINRNVDEDVPSEFNVFNIQDAATALGTETSGFTRPNSGDVKIGMEFRADVEITKTIFKPIVLDSVPDEDCTTCTKDQVVKTNKFEVDHTNDLFVGMEVINNRFTSYLVSIDCEKTITIDREQEVFKGETLTFKHKASGRVENINTGADGVIVTSSTPIILPHKTELVFHESREADINGNIKIDKQGQDEIVITTTINDIFIGREDVTFGINYDSFISTKPSARDKYFEVGVNSPSNPLHLIENTSSRYDSQTITLVGTYEGTASATYILGEKEPINALAYAPPTSKSGSTKVKFTISDGKNTSEEKTAFIKIR
jgi:hypothetical protein